MALKLPTGYGVAKGIVYGGAGGGIFVYLGAIIHSVWTGHAFDPSTFGLGFTQVIGSSTAAVVGHSRYMQGGADGVSSQTNSGS
jgi:hypothetical protein